MYIEKIKEKHTLLSEHRVCSSHVFRGGLSGLKKQRKPTKIKEKQTLLSEHRVCNYHVFREGAFLGTKSKENQRKIKEKTHASE